MQRTPSGLQSSMSIDPDGVDYQARALLAGIVFALTPIVPTTPISPQALQARWLSHDVTCPKQDPETYIHLTHFISMWCQAADVPVVCFDIHELNLGAIEFHVLKFALATEDDFLVQSAPAPGINGKGRRNKAANGYPLQLAVCDKSKQRSISECREMDLSDSQLFNNMLNSLDTQPFEMGDGENHAGYGTHVNSRYIIDNGRNSLCFQSMPDGMCFYHALVKCLNIPMEVAVPEFFWPSRTHNNGAVNYQEAASIGNYLGVKVMSVNSFYEHFGHVELQSLAANNTKGHDVHYMILVNDTHSYIVYDPRAVQRTKYCDPALYSQQGEEDNLWQVRARASAATGLVRVVIDKKVVKKREPIPPYVVKDLNDYPDHTNCANANFIKNWAIEYRLSEDGYKPRRPNRKLVCCKQAALAFAFAQPSKHSVFENYEVTHDEPKQFSVVYYSNHAHLIRGKSKVVDAPVDEDVINDLATRYGKPADRSEVQYEVDICGEPRLISRKALDELQLSKIVAIHCDSIPTIFTDQPRRYTPHFNVRSNKDGASLRANLRAQQLPLSALAVLHTWSIDIGVKDNREVGLASSAHAFARFVQDNCQAQVLSRILSTHAPKVSFQAGGPHRYAWPRGIDTKNQDVILTNDNFSCQIADLNVIVDVGSKFTSLVNTLSKIGYNSKLRLAPMREYSDDVHSVLGDSYDEFVWCYDGWVKAVGEAQDQLSKNLPLTQGHKKILGDAYEECRAIHFFHVQAEDQQKVLQMAAQDWFRPVHLITIRPCETDYDKQYWRENKPDLKHGYSESKLINAQLAVTYFKGTIQEWQEIVKDDGGKSLFPNIAVIDNNLRNDNFSLYLEKFQDVMLDQYQDYSDAHYQKEVRNYHGNVRIDTIGKDWYQLARNLDKSFKWCNLVHEYEDRAGAGRPKSLNQELALPWTFGASFMWSSVFDEFVSCNRKGYHLTYTFMDSHYYIPLDHQFLQNEYKPDQIATTGGCFYEQPGSYRLPFGDGYFVVAPTGQGITGARLVMNTRGGSNIYDHACINYDDAAAYYDSGWYAWFYDICDESEWRNKRRHVQVLNTDLQPQARWFKESLDQVQNSMEKKSGVISQSIHTIQLSWGKPPSRSYLDVMTDAVLDEVHNWRHYEMDDNHPRIGLLRRASQNHLKPSSEAKVRLDVTPIRRGKKNTIRAAGVGASIALAVIVCPWLLFVTVPTTSIASRMVKKPITRTLVVDVDPDYQPLASRMKEDPTEIRFKDLWKLMWNPQANIFRHTFLDQPLFDVNPNIIVSYAQGDPKMMIRGKTTYGYQEDWTQEKPPKQKIRVEVSGSEDQIAVDYYKLKRPEPLEGVNQYIDCDGRNLQRMTAFYHYSLSNSDKQVQKGKLVQYQHEKSMVLKTGYEAIASGRFSEADGGNAAVQVFEWDKRPIVNQYAAMRRHLSATCTPTESVQFRAFCNRFFDDVMPQVLSELLGTEIQSFREYPHKAFPDQFEKRQKYLQYIPLSLDSPDLNLEKGCYQSMVKSGEVYQTSNPKYDGQYFVDDSRPRDIKNPCGIAYTVHAAVQHQLFPALRKVLPAFIQAMTSEQIADRFMERCSSTSTVVSIDGSSFDSTQHAINKDSVEGEFFRRLRPFFIRLFGHTDNQVKGMSPEEAADTYIAAATATRQIVFLNLPGIGGQDVPQWTTSENAQFKKYMRGSKQDYLPFTLDGTTFSGDPHTTLGNTLRTMCYCYYYVRETHASPWNDPQLTLMVSGDDALIATNCPKRAREYKRLILANTSRKPDQSSPLGQCVKSATYGPPETAEFCSKWFHIDGSNIILTRDYVKTLCTKQFYTRKNAHILRNPAIHRYAIYSGLKSEEASQLLEDIVLAATPPAPKTGLNLVDDFLKRQYNPTPTAYKVQESVNC